jgi:uncharacterized protein DUF1153
MTELSSCSERDHGADASSLHSSRELGDAVSSDGTWGTWGKGGFAVPREGKRANYIIGPNGDVITLADLPSPSTTRWVIRRKAEVVLAVHAGLLSLDEACKRYRLTVEEFSSWKTAIERHGLLALRTTQLQQYRHGEDEPVLARGWHAPRPPRADRFVFTEDDVS